MWFVTFTVSLYRFIVEIEESRPDALCGAPLTGREPAAMVSGGPSDLYDAAARRSPLAVDVLAAGCSRLCQTLIVGYGA